MHPAVAALRRTLAADGFDGIVVSHPANRFYLSGYRAADIPPDETAGFLLITADRVMLVTSFLNLVEAQAQAAGFEVVERGRQIERAVGLLIQELGLRRVAVEEEAMLLGWLRVIREHAGAGPELEPTRTTLAGCG
jgi:Xaa-Pro aminopeptidase